MLLYFFTHHFYTFPIEDNDLNIELFLLNPFKITPSSYHIFHISLNKLGIWETGSVKNSCRHFKHWRFNDTLKFKHFLLYSNKNTYYHILMCRFYENKTKYDAIWVIFSYAKWAVIWSFDRTYHSHLKPRLSSWERGASFSQYLIVCVKCDRFAIKWHKCEQFRSIPDFNRISFSSFLISFYCFHTLFFSSITGCHWQNTKVIARTVNVAKVFRVSSGDRATKYYCI